MIVNGFFKKALFICGHLATDALRGMGPSQETVRA
jgi:hypothetical protein